MKRIFKMTARKATVLAAAGLMTVGISSTALGANGTTGSSAS